MKHAYWYSQAVLWEHVASLSLPFGVRPDDAQRGHWFIYLAVSLDLAYFFVD